MAAIQCGDMSQSLVDKNTTTLRRVCALSFLHQRAGKVATEVASHLLSWKINLAARNTMRKCGLKLTLSEERHWHRSSLCAWMFETRQSGNDPQVNSSLLDVSRYCDDRCNDAHTRYTASALAAHFAGSQEASRGQNSLFLPQGGHSRAHHKIRNSTLKRRFTSQRLCVSVPFRVFPRQQQFDQKQHFCRRTQFK